MAINLIKISEFPESVDTKNWMVVADSNGISYKISIDNVKAELGIGALMQYRGSVVPTSPAQPEGDFFVTATQDGTYTDYGGVVVPTNSFAVISRVGGVYTSSITGLDTNAVLKTELPALAYTKPVLFGKTQISPGLSASNRTVIFKEPIPMNSFLKSVSFIATTAGPVSIKRFKLSIDGLTLLYKGQKTFPAVVGLNQVPVDNLYFDKDDLIGVYSTAGIQYIDQANWSDYWFLISGGLDNSIITDQPLSAMRTNDSPADFQMTFELSQADIPFVYEEELFQTFDNLFNENIAIFEGSYLRSANGEPFARANCAYTDDYIPVQENTTYTLNGVSLIPPTANVVVFYNASKDIIGFVSNVQNYTHTTPPETAFVRFNVRYDSLSDDYSRIYYVEGSEAGGKYIKPELIKIEDSSIAPVADIYMVPCYGQSLSINTDAGPSTFTDPVSIAYTQAGVNSNIQDMNGGYAEMFLALSKENKALPAGFKMMTCLGGAGGRSVLQLSRGTTYYNTLMNNIVAGQNYAIANGLTYNVPAFMWTQGEEDYRCAGVPGDYGFGDWDPFEYSTKLKQLIDDINVDVKAITGQTNDVKCIMYQLACHNAYKRYPRIALEQLKLALADERVSLAKVMYEADYNVADWVHAPAKTYRNMGNHYGIALYNAVVKNERVLPIVPSQHFFQGNDLYVRFKVPCKPLVFDTDIVAPLADGNYGFNLYTVTNEANGTLGTIALASQTITGVTLFSEDTVKITLSGIPPAGTRLTYGVNGEYWEYIGGRKPELDAFVGKSGRTLGARGNLRDSRSFLNKVDNYFTLYNWCPIFEIIL